MLTVLRTHAGLMCFAFLLFVVTFLRRLHIALAGTLLGLMAINIIFGLAVAGII